MGGGRAPSPGSRRLVLLGQVPLEVVDQLAARDDSANTNRHRTKLAIVNESANSASRHATEKAAGVGVVECEWHAGIVRQVEVDALICHALSTADNPHEVEQAGGHRDPVVSGPAAVTLDSNGKVSGDRGHGHCVRRPRPTTGSRSP